MNLWWGGLLANIFLLVSVLSPYERKQFYSLIGFVSAVALLEALGLASVFPVLTFIMRPDVLETNEVMQLIYHYFGFSSASFFSAALALSAILIFNFSQFVKALSFHRQNKFFLNKEAKISTKLFNDIITNSYESLRSKHSADQIKIILSETGAITHQGFSALMSFISNGFIIIFIVILLFVVDYFVALIILSIFTFFFFVMFFLFKDLLIRLGQVMVETNRLRYRTLNEAFGSLREIKFKNNEYRFVDVFKTKSQEFAQAQAQKNLISQLPRYGLEAAAVSIVLVVAAHSVFASTTNEVVPLLAIYAIAGYRLLPASQMMFFSAASLQSLGASLNVVCNIAKDEERAPNGGSALVKASKDKDQGLDLTSPPKLNARNICFKYNDSDVLALDNVSIGIEPGSFVAIIGESGSGKTTFVDVLLGLLEPTNGEIEIFHGDLVRKLSQEYVGYVPQNICLFDSSIADNIVFGSGPVNLDKINEVIEKVSLKNFVAELPEGINTFVGEQGSRLSGGQKQRIGIARALYNSPKILVLDEPTSALDAQAEKAVMTTLKHLRDTVSIVLITHNLEIIKNADKIYVLSAGRIVDFGDYTELKNKSNI